jgi:hypothetical protein
MTEKSHHVKVNVTFAAADRPYRHEYADGTLISTVLADALTAFAITSDGTSRYYLVHDGGEVPGDKTVGEVAGHAKAIHLKLRTELIQGAS